MNKWTPIEEGLPPVATPLIVSVVNNFEGKRKELRYPVYFELHPFEQRWCGGLTMDTYCRSTVR